MVAAYVSTSHQSYNGSGSTSAVLPSPSGATAGDLAIVVLHLESGIKTITKPTGWTEEAQLNSGTTLSLYILWKRLTGSEVAADRTFSWTGGCWRTADMILVRGGASSGNPFGGTLGEATGTGTSRTSISYTTSGAGLGFWIHGNFADSGGVTLPSGYTSRATNTEHDFRFADRTDTSGSKTTGAGSGTAVAWVAFAQTCLDTAASADGSVTAVTATATAAGVVPTVTGGATVTDVAATSTAAAVAPTAVGGATVTSVTATATATAPLPTVAGGALVAGVAATATSLALPPTLAGGAVVTGVVATATAAALAPVVSPGETPNGNVNAVPATATAAGVAPTATGGAQTASMASTSTALALPPTVTGGGAVIGVRATAIAQGHVPVVAGAGAGGNATVSAVPARAIAHSQHGIAHTPLVITTGGTYSGGFARSTSSSVPAISIQTTSPVTITGMSIMHAGAGIEASASNSQVTVTNCHFQATPPSTTGAEQQAIRAWEPTTLIFEDNNIENSHGVQVSGEATHTTTTLRIDRNMMRNIGRHSQPSYYQGAVHLDNVQCPGGKIRWNKVFNMRGFSHCEDTIACSNGTAGALGNVIEFSYNMVNGTYPISGDGSSFTGGAYDFADIDGGYIEAHHNYALNYTNNGIMNPEGHDVSIHDCVVVFDGLADDGQRCSTEYGWGFMVANLYNGGEIPNSFLQNNRCGHARWIPAWNDWQDANYYWNDANGTSQDLGGNVEIPATAAMEKTILAEYDQLVATNAVTIGASGSLVGVAPVVTGGATVSFYKTHAIATAYAPVVTGVRNATVSVPLIFMQAYCPHPQVNVSYPLFRFEPPTHEAPMWTNERPHNYHRLTHAASVVRVNGVLTTIHQPRPDQIEAAGEEGVDWFIGGRVYDVSAAVKAELLSAGFPVS